MSDPKYDVAEILWVIRSDRPGMIALQVQEVITKRTIKGEDIQYLVSTPANSKSFLLHTVQGKIFTSIDDAKEDLYRQATDAIDSVIEKVQAQAVKYFEVPHEHAPNVAVDFINPSTAKKEVAIKELIAEEGYEIVEMDGQQVKIKLPAGI